MSPLAPNKSINPNLNISSHQFAKDNKNKMMTKVPQVTPPRPVAFNLTPEDLKKRVIPFKGETMFGVENPVANVVNVSNNVVKSQNPRTLPNGQPILASASNTRPGKPAEKRSKYLSRSRMIEILEGAPADVDKLTLIEDIAARGYVMEGYNDPESLIAGQTPTLGQRQYPLGRKQQPKQVPLQGGARRGISRLGGNWGNGEWMNPVGRVAEIIDDTVQKIPTINTGKWARKRLEERVANLSDEEIREYRERFDNSKTAQKFYDNFDQYVYAKEKTLLEELAGVSDAGPNLVNMLGNAPRSLLATATATARGMTNPVDTAQGLYTLVGTPEGRQIIKDRYGTVEGFEQALETDAVGVASDLLTVVQLGAGTASQGARLGGTVAKATGLVDDVSRLSQFADDASRISAQAGGAADLGVGVGIDKAGGVINKISNPAVRNVVKVATAGAQPGQLMDVGKDVGKGLTKILPDAEKTLQNMNRVTKGEQSKFAKQQGVSVGKWLNDRGIVGNTESTLNKLSKWFEDSYKQADEGLSQIQGRYKDVMFEKMLDDSVRYADNTLDDKLSRLQELQTSYKKDGGLEMTEINEVKRYFQRNNKFSYGRDMTAGEKTKWATNVDNAVRKRQFDIAEKNGFSNLKDINKETQASKFILDKLGKNAQGSLGNNYISLTDWMVGAGSYIEPTMLAGLVGKKVFSSDWFKSRYVNLLNKINGHENIGQKVADLYTISKIQDAKTLDKYLALPNKLDEGTVDNLNSGNPSDSINRNQTLDTDNTNRSTVDISDTVDGGLRRGGGGGPGDGSGGGGEPTHNVISPDGTIKTDVVQSPRPMIDRSNDVIEIDNNATQPGTTKISDEQIRLQEIVKKKAQQLLMQEEVTNKIQTARQQLQSNPDLQKVAPMEPIPSNIEGRGYTTPMGDIDRVEYDRGRAVYYVNGRGYRAGEIDIYKPKLSIELQRGKEVVANQKLEKLKAYEAVGQRRKQYISDLLGELGLEKIDDIPIEYVDDVYEMIAKRKRDDAGYAKWEKLKQKVKQSTKGQTIKAKHLLQDSQVDLDRLNSLLYNAQGDKFILNHINTSSVIKKVSDVDGLYSAGNLIDGGGSAIVIVTDLKGKGRAYYNGDHIAIDTKVFNGDKTIRDQVLRHELEHVGQMERGEISREKPSLKPGQKGYRDQPHEVAARKASGQDLQPLYEEAKKYKSADEWIDSLKATQERLRYSEPTGRAKNKTRGRISNYKNGPKDSDLAEVKRLNGLGLFDRGGFASSPKLRSDFIVERIKNPDGTVSLVEVNMKSQLRKIREEANK